MLDRNYHKAIGGEIPTEFAASVQHVRICQAITGQAVAEEHHGEGMGCLGTVVVRKLLLFLC